MFLKLTADQVLVFFQIAGSCQLNLLKTGLDCFFLYNIIVLLLCFVFMVIIKTHRRPNSMQETSTQSYKTQIKTLTFPGLA